MKKSLLYTIQSINNAPSESQWERLASIIESKPMNYSHEDTELILSIAQNANKLSSSKAQAIVRIIAALCCSHKEFYDRGKTALEQFRHESPDVAFAIIDALNNME